MKVKAPVPELYASGKVAESEVDDTLLLKVVQSVDERYPFVELFAWEMERVFPENESGAETVAEVTWPVPFPVRMPPRVVEPVPPLATVSAVARVSAPVEEKEEVADPPKYATVAESCVEDAAPLKSIKEVVADCPAAGWVQASYERRPEEFSVIGEEPKMTGVPPEKEMPVPAVRVVVETPYTPAPPFDTRTWLELSVVVVARPVYVMVAFVPPTSEPRVPEVTNGPETAKVEVATF